MWLLKPGGASAVFVVLLAVFSGASAQTLKIFPVMEHQKIPVGKSVVLTCLVEAPEPKLIFQPQWENPQGDMIPENGYGFRQPIYSEPSHNNQAEVLYITNMSESVAGNYTCVSAYANQPLRKSVIIDTFVAITWTNAAPKQAAVKGEDYKVMCEVSAQPAPTVNWFKDGIPILTGDRFVVQSNGLTIKNIRESDEGTYSCRVVVTFTGEMSERNILLEVLTAPDMERRDSVILIKEGESATITCKARGVPPPLYSWIKASTKQNLSVTPRFFVNQMTGQLTINPVSASDYGGFICHALNRAGEKQVEYKLEVLVKPRVDDLYNSSFPEGSEARLECTARGRPAPIVTFRKLSSDQPFASGINLNPRVTIETTCVEVGDLYETKTSVLISKLKRSDDGLYECHAKNDGGITRKNALMTVQFKPTFQHMQHFPIWSWNRQPVNISCVAESIPNATIKWKYHDRDLVETPQTRIFGSGPYSYVTVIPTDRGFYGIYKCIATNFLGEAVHTIQLREASVPAAIANIHQESLSATSVVFNILSPGEEMGPPIIAITVQYKENVNYDWNYSLNRTWSANSLYVVEQLKPMMSYDFRFAAVNQVGAGPWSKPITLTMPKRSPPEKPAWRQNVSEESLVRSKYPDQFEVKWKIPEDNGEPIDMYTLEYCPVIKVTGEWRVSGANECVRKDLKYTEQVHYMLTDLNPDSRYRIALKAHNILGFSLASQLYVQTTPGVKRVDAEVPPKKILSSGAIIGLALAGVFLVLLILDLCLLCCKNTGVIAFLCTRQVRRRQEPEIKLGRDEKEPLRDEETLRRDTSIEFDGHRVIVNSGTIIGKNSAV